MGLNLFGGLDWLTGADKKMKVSAPPPRDYSAEISNILKSSEDVYQNAVKYNPLYTQLGLQTQQQATTGLSGMYGGLAREVGNTNQGLVNDFATQFAQSLRGINPDQSGLYDQLTQQASQGLRMGNALSPQEQYNINSGVRGNFANRGLGQSNGSDLYSALGLMTAGDNRLQQRQSFAQQMTDMGNSLYTQPAANMAMASGGMNAGNILQMGGGMAANTPNNFNQLSPYGSDVYNTNYNADAAARIATANNATGMMSSMMSY